MLQQFKQGLTWRNAPFLGQLSPHVETFDEPRSLSLCLYFLKNINVKYVSHLDPYRLPYLIDLFWLRSPNQGVHCLLFNFLKLIKLPPSSCSSSSAITDSFVGVDPALLTPNTITFSDGPPYGVFRHYIIPRGRMQRLCTMYSCSVSSCVA